MRFDLSVSVIGGSDLGRQRIHEGLLAVGVSGADAGLEAAVVLCDLPSAAALTGTSPETWAASVEQPLHGALAALIDARAHLAGGGAIAMVVPNVGVAGAAQLVALTTLVEGVRAMAKSAARQWAADGLTVNLLGLPLATLAPDLEPLTRHLPATASSSPGPTDIGNALVPLLQAPAAMTGATVMLDGGSVMVP